MASDTAHSPRLGVIGLLADTARTVVANAVALVGPVFPLALATTYLTEVLAARLLLAGFVGFGDWFNGGALFLVASLLVGVVMQALAIVVALRVLNRQGLHIAAIAVKLGRSLPALLVLSVAYYVMFFIGMSVAVIPGLWIASVFAVYGVAILQEDRGMGALRRSADLTSGYRWPIAGAHVVLFLAIVLLSVPGYFFPKPAVSTLALWVTAAASTLVYASLAVFQIVLWRRLVEIKESGGSEVAEIFA